MQTSPIRNFRVLLGFGVCALACAALAMFADAARQRAEKANPAKPPYGMCWDGELALTQLMAPTFPAPDELAAFVAATVRRQDLARSGVCRVAHVMAAYWRLRARGLAD